MSGRTVWTGTASALLDALGQEVSEAVRREKSWPSSPRALSGRLRRAATFLRKVGVEIASARRAGLGPGLSGLRLRQTMRGCNRPHRLHRPRQSRSPTAATAWQLARCGRLASMQTVVRTVSSRGRGPTVCVKPLSLNAENAADGADANSPDLSASRERRCSSLEGTAVSAAEALKAARAAGVSLRVDGDDLLLEARLHLRPPCSMRSRDIRPMSSCSCGQLGRVVARGLAGLLRRACRHRRVRAADWREMQPRLAPSRAASASG